MIHLYIYSLLAGLIGTNGIPHFIKGVTGQKHQTPFGKGSSATVNVIFGWVNFVVAMLALHFAHPHAHELRSFTCLAIGSLIMGIFSAKVWTKHPEYNM
jgi:hypothetical protein